MPPQTKDEGSTRNLKRKAANKAVGSGLVKDICKLI